MRGPESWMCSASLLLVGVQQSLGVTYTWQVWGKGHLWLAPFALLAAVFILIFRNNVSKNSGVTLCFMLLLMVHNTLGQSKKKQSMNKRKLIIKVKQDMNKWSILKMKHKNQILTMKEMIQEEHGWTWYKDRGEGKQGNTEERKKMQWQNQTQQHDCKSETQIRNTCFTVVWVHCGHTAAQTRLLIFRIAVLAADAALHPLWWWCRSVVAWAVHSRVLHTQKPT